MQRTDSFGQLIELLEGEPLYAPGAADLTTAGLREYYSQMHNANRAMPGIPAQVLTARQQRNAALYHKVSGLLALAQPVKAYVEPGYGVKDPQAKAIRRIKFKWPKEE